MKNFETFVFMILGACAVCHGVEKFKEIGTSGALTPPPERPEIPNAYPSHRRDPPSIPTTCLGGSSCDHKLTWPREDYPPSQPDFSPTQDDFRDTYSRRLSERFRRAVDPRFIRLGRQKRHLTPPPERPEIPNAFPSHRREPPSIPTTCLGGSPCDHKLTWPREDYPPSQPDFRPTQEDFRDTYPRRISERFRRAVDPRFIRFGRQKRSPSNPKIGTSGALTPPPERPEIPNAYPSHRREPPSIPTTCLGGSPCGHKLTWPREDYPPSQPDFRPTQDDFRDTYPRRISERFRRAVSPRLGRQKRSPLVRDQLRGPVITPYFCHKMPCSGPLSSFPQGKGESSGRYQLPERSRMLN